VVAITSYTRHREQSLTQKQPKAVRKRTVAFGSGMGVDEKLARSGLRVSFGWSSCEEDVGAIVASLRTLVRRRAAMAA